MQRIFSRFSSSRAWLSLMALAMLALVGCKPEPPTLLVTSSEFVSLSPTNFGLRVHLTATNPNGIDVTVRSVAARVSTQGRPLGTVTLPQVTVLTANQTTPVTVDVSLPLTATAELGRLALGSPEIPYRIEGTVTAGTFFFTIPVPFQKDGTVTRQELLTHLGPKVPALLLGK